MPPDLIRYRVWPDGWVQDADDEPCAWRSDDCMIVEAEDEGAALAEFEHLDADAWGCGIQQT